MKLYYFKHEIGNFGDDLNPWIWSSVLPGIFDDDENEIFLGIGTLINHRIPVVPKKIVFGSGAGYGRMPEIDDRWEFYCVRGPLTAEKLGLDRNLAITDPAILLKRLVTSEAVRKENQIAFMPHHDSTIHANWKGVCELAGLTYIDPAEDMHQVIEKIRKSKLLIAEAMHGAIVADAFRTPWVPVVCYDHILSFKWNDWCKSLGLDYKPIRIDSLWDAENDLSLKAYIKNKVKRSLVKAGLGSKNWTKPIQASNRKKVEGGIIEKLSSIARAPISYLSEDAQHEDALQRLESVIEKFRRKYSV